MFEYLRKHPYYPSLLGYLSWKNIPTRLAGGEDHPQVRETEEVVMEPDDEPSPPTEAPQASDTLKKVT